MIVLMDSTHKAAQELVDLGMEVGQLITPLTGYKRWSDVWAMDNGAYSRFDGDAFQRKLKREWEARHLCKFVCCPDVVGSARRTLEVFRLYQNRIQGWPLALVLQDGIEDLDIPWDHISAVFIGGTNDFKNSESAMQCAKAAKILDKWVHVGRVNTPERFDRWKDIADSCDGSGLARYTHMRQNLAQGMPLLDLAEEAQSADVL